MNKTTDLRQPWLRLAALVMVMVMAVTAMYGCTGGIGGIAQEDSGTPAQEQTQPALSSAEDIKEFYTGQICQMYSDLTAQLPTEFAALVPAVSGSPVLTVSGADVFGAAVSGSDAASVTSAADSAKASLVRPAALSLLRLMADTAKGMGDKQTVPMVEQALAELESEAAQAASLTSMCDCLFSAESRIFGSLAQGTEDQPGKHSASSVLWRDENSTLWLKIYTTFPLPPLNDSEHGFSLRLMVDNGKTFETAADSIYRSEVIEYDGLHSVRFDLTRMLEGLTAEQFFAGRNRVFFSLYSLDNSDGFTQDFYRMSLSDATADNYADAYLTLLQLAAAYDVPAPGKEQL